MELDRCAPLTPLGLGTVGLGATNDSGRLRGGGKGGAREPPPVTVCARLSETGACAMADSGSSMSSSPLLDDDVLCPFGPLGSVAESSVDSEVVLCVRRRNIADPTATSSNGGAGLGVFRSRSVGPMCVDETNLGLGATNGGPLADPCRVISGLIRSVALRGCDEEIISIFAGSVGGGARDAAPARDGRTIGLGAGTGARKMCCTDGTDRGGGGGIDALDDAGFPGRRGGKGGTAIELGGADRGALCIDARRNGLLDRLDEALGAAVCSETTRRNGFPTSGAVPSPTVRTTATSRSRSGGCAWRKTWSRQSVEQVLACATRRRIARNSADESRWGAPKKLSTCVRELRA